MYTGWRTLAGSGGSHRSPRRLAFRSDRAGVITELRLARLSADDVASVAPEVASLLAAYEAELADMALTDWPGILSLATKSVPSHPLPGLPLLMLDVPVATTASLGFVQALAAAAADILATVPAADRTTLARLRDELHWTVEDLDPDPSRPPSLASTGAGALT